MWIIGKYYVHENSTQRKEANTDFRERGNWVNITEGGVTETLLLRHLPILQLQSPYKLHTLSSFLECLK
jgi:hypothetical protein